MEYHSVGTCRMGTDDLAVVAPQLRGKRGQGLRLASAAIMPTVPSANTHAASMMVGGCAGRLLLESD